jgi:hypothetical protein
MATSYVNTDWVNTVTKQIDQIPDCAALAELIQKVEAVIKAQLEAMLQQIADLAKLAIPPTNLKKLIKWAKEHCAKYMEMYMNAVATYTALVKAYGDLLTAIQNKLNNLKCNIQMPKIEDIAPKLEDTELYQTVNGVLTIPTQIQTEITFAGNQAAGYIASKPTLDRPNP